MPKLASSPKKVLWANPVCLLDTSSGASLSAREMLRQLSFRGLDIRILGAAVFDNTRGISQDVASHLSRTPSDSRFTKIVDGPLVHELLCNKGRTARSMTGVERRLWLKRYIELLDSYQPDLVFFYGGGDIRQQIIEQARSRGISCAVYVVSSGYLKIPEAFKGIDLAITDSTATAELYKKKAGISLNPVGKFIDPANVRSEHHARARALFVNPAPAKGAVIVAALSLLLAKRRPDIIFEVVQSRGNWHLSAQKAARALGITKQEFGNVVLTPNQTDMRPVYQRARILLAPSLRWDSGPRVVVEALINGLPIVGTNRGGIPELTGDAGLLFRFPDRIYQSPYMRLPSKQMLMKIGSLIEHLYDDPTFYETQCTRAKEIAEVHHGLDASTDRLIACLQEAAILPAEM